MTGLKRVRRRRWAHAAAICATTLSATGCISVRSSHGYILERGETELDARVGVDSKDSVIAKYGEPSIRSTFGDDAWYYLASRDAARAFFKPDIVSQEVVGFHFADDGTVERVERVGLESSVGLRIASKETPTRGRELTFWEQLLGSVGQLPGVGAGGVGQGPGGPGGP